MSYRGWDGRRANDLQHVRELTNVGGIVHGTHFIIDVFLVDIDGHGVDEHGVVDNTVFLRHELVGGVVGKDNFVVVYVLAVQRIPRQGNQAKRHVKCVTLFK